VDALDGAKRAVLEPADEQFGEIVGLVLIARAKL